MPARVRLSAPGDFIASVPALLGFVPHRSLVVVFMTSTGARPAMRVAATARIDLDSDSGSHRWINTLTSRVTSMARRVHAPDVMVIAVGDGVAAPFLDHPAATHGSRRSLIDSVERSLAAGGVRVVSAWTIAAISAGQRWWRMDGTESGPLPDPVSSELAAHGVVAGRPVFSSRSELAALLATDPKMQERVAAALPTAVTVARQRFARLHASSDLRAYRRAAMERVLWAIADLDASCELGPDRLAQVAVATRDQVVRDSLLALAATPHAAVVEQFWVTVTRSIPAPDRSEAATLLAYTAYVRGNGPLAGIAADNALADDPDNRLAKLLNQALASGMPPGHLRETIDFSAKTAASFGIDLGPTDGLAQPQSDFR